MCQSGFLIDWFIDNSMYGSNLTDPLWDSSKRQQIKNHSDFPKWFLWSITDDDEPKAVIIVTSFASSLIRT